jgi:ribosomal-protein-alanine N-acetyltransferase
MNFQLVPMDRGHVAQVAGLERSCFPDPWSEQTLEQALYHDLSSLVVAEGENGAVLGYGVIQAVLDEGCLDRIAVNPAYRRQGVAQAILDCFLRFGHEHLAFLTLEVRASNTPAIQFYLKNGFEQVGRRANYYQNPKEDAIIMTLEFEK